MPFVINDLDLFI